MHFFAREEFLFLGCSGEAEDAVCSTCQYEIFGKAKLPPQKFGFGSLTIAAANEALSESLTNVASGSDHENVDHFGERVEDSKSGGIESFSF